MADKDSTTLRYQHDAKLYKLKTKVHSVRSLASLEEDNRNLFKTADNDKDFVLTTAETIFHPQGGGQPSDEGTIAILQPTTSCAEANSTPLLEMKSARHDALNPSLVLHLVRFTCGHVEPDSLTDAEVELSLDVEKRLLYSRLHTAGHVLGGAVRHTVGSSVPDFDELKASHFPDSAACEFRGVIEGSWKEPIQGKLNQYVKDGLPVEIDFWRRADFEREGLLRLIPEGWDEGEALRVVRIVGADTYPCGGTHVDSTDLCGEVAVKKIARKQGNSRIGYTIS